METEGALYILALQYKYFILKGIQSPKSMQWAIWMHMWGFHTRLTPRARGLCISLKIDPIDMSDLSSGQIFRRSQAWLDNGLDTVGRHVIQLHPNW